MTDYRRSEEELWDEDEVAEEDRRTNVLPLFPDSGVADVLSEPDPEPEAAAATSGSGESAPASDAVGSVARFIAESGASAAPGPVDGPQWSLSALALIADDGARAPTNDAAHAAPPALPPPVPAKSEPLPSMMLGPAMSMRGDATERVTTIPKTHPLANSIAPGGSRVTVPPSRTRVPQRWHLAIAALALLGVGAGAALFSQSRGEHHAASGTRQAAAERREEPRVVLEPLEETTIIMEEPPAPTVIEADVANTVERAPSTPAPEQAPSDRAPSNERPQLARPRALRLATMLPSPSEQTTERADRKLRVSVGAVELREASEPGVQPPLDRAQVIAAMNGLAAALRSCVGEQHGVADVTLTVRGSGVVSHALVEGTFAGSEKGSCIARTLRTAKLPPSPQAVLHIAYPLQL